MTQVLISHRGNINGPNKQQENSPEYIINALNLGYNVEIDVWCINGHFFLGHDKPQYYVDESFLINSQLWCHAKNIDALEIMLNNPKIHCFWHENDTVTITSKGFIWTFPGSQLISNSIACLPEMIIFDNIEKAHGICSDFISKYK